MKVLISGAGIAGPTLAYWLARYGFEPTIVEKAPRLRSERNHQGLRNQLISPEAGHLGSAGEIQRRQRLGGMLNYYYRAAA